MIVSERWDNGQHEYYCCEPGWIVRATLHVSPQHRRMGMVSRPYHLSAGTACQVQSTRRDFDRECHALRDEYIRVSDDKRINASRSDYRA